MGLKEMFDEKGILTQEAIKEFKKRGSDVSCECPEHLVNILKSVKDFTLYQEKCLIEKPSDELTHQWLKATSMNIEHLLSGTIVNLARMEGLIDENNDFTDLEKK